MNQESVVPRIHDLREMDMDSAYDETQCNMSVHTGDVLLVEDGIAIMYLAWPMMVVGTSRVFHTADVVLLEKDLASRGMAGKISALTNGLLLAWAVACG